MRAWRRWKNKPLGRKRPGAPTLSAERAGMMKHASVLTIAIALATIGATSAAVRYASPDGNPVGKHDIHVTLKPGQSYTIPLPVTAYPGAPFHIAVAALNFQPPGSSGQQYGWLMRVTASSHDGALSWIGEVNWGSTTEGGWAAPGQSALMDFIGEGGSSIAVIMTAVPVGSVEGVQLSVPSSSAFGTQPLVISVSGA